MILVIFLIIMFVQNVMILVRNVVKINFIVQNVIPQNFWCLLQINVN